MRLANRRTQVETNFDKRVINFKVGEGIGGWIGPDNTNIHVGEVEVEVDDPEHEELELPLGKRSSKVKRRSQDAADFLKILSVSS